MKTTGVLLLAIVAGLSLFLLPAVAGGGGLGDEDSLSNLLYLPPDTIRGTLIYILPINAVENFSGLFVTKQKNEYHAWFILSPGTYADLLQAQGLTDSQSNKLFSTLSFGGGMILISNFEALNAETGIVTRDTQVAFFTKWTN